MSVWASKDRTPIPMTRTAVFVSYNGILDPLGQSQILPYLERLRAAWSIHILSFERKERASETAVSALRERLRKQEIRWTALRYHKRPGVVAKAYDVISGVAALRRILKSEDVSLIHARGYLPAEIAFRATTRHPVLFDIRGLQGEEYVDGGIWKSTSVRYKLLKRSEESFFERAAGAVVLTEAIREYVSTRFAAHSRQPPISVIPCCVEMERFQFDPRARLRRRQEIDARDETCVLAYSGSLGTWYLAREMAQFAHAFRKTTGRPVKLLWLLNNGIDIAKAASRAAGLAESDYSLVSANSDEVPEFLSCADAALALVRPCFSKKASSPTKYAESLAIGLPLVLCNDVGDSRLIEAAGGAVALEYPMSETSLTRR